MPKADTNRTVAVTGSTGLVGSHLVAELLRRGHSGIVLPVRSVASLEKLHRTLRREGVEFDPGKFRVVETELNDPVRLTGIFRGVDTVFNCAAAVSLGGMDPGRLVGDNVEIAMHVVNACIDTGVRMLVHVSSIAALGKPLPGTDVVTEGSHLESLAGLPPYYVGKFLSEQEVVRGRVSGLATVVVNPAVILGAGDWRSGSTVIIPTLARGVPFYTDGATGYVDVRDVARAMVLLAESPAAVGQRFILVGANARYRELLDMAAGASGARRPRFRAGPRLLAVAAAASQAVAWLRGRRSPFTREVARAMLDETRYSNEKIVGATGFEFTPLEQTLRRVIGEYMNDKNK